MKRYNNELLLNFSADIGLDGFVGAAAHAANKGFEIAGVQCFANTFVQGGSSVLRMKPVLRLPAIANPENVVVDVVAGKAKLTPQSKFRK